MRRKKSAGFTLIELLIVLMIVGMILGMVGISISSWLPRYYLKSAARDVKSNMLLCRMRAVKDNCNSEFSFVTSGVTAYTMQSALTCPSASQYTETVDIGTSYRGNVQYGRAGHGRDTLYDKGPVDNAYNTFTDNKAVFQPSGRPAGSGTIYLQNARGADSFAISMNIAGSITIRKWDSSSGSWVSL